MTRLLLAVSVSLLTGTLGWMALVLLRRQLFGDPAPVVFVEPYDPDGMFV